jgi:RHS repeat-associated protein
MRGYGFTSAGTSYDDEDRLTGYARTSGTFTQSWNLTKVGDWTSVTTNGTAQNRTHGPTHELLTAGGQNVSTDATNLFGSFTLQLSAYTLPPTSFASYIDEPVVRKAAGTGGTIHYYHRNQQYSITAMTTSSGAVAERYAYAAYGQPTILNASGTVHTSSAVGNRYTYTGREWDETLGLHHFRARWLSPLAGRFLGRDPIGYRLSHSNLFSFLDGQVFKTTDPDGRTPVQIGACAIGAVSSGLGAFIVSLLTEDLTTACKKGACAGVNGCATGAAATFGPLAGCIGGVIGTVLQTGCEAGLGVRPPISMCDAANMLVSTLLGCAGGSLVGGTQQIDQEVARLLVLIGINVGTWTQYCTPVPILTSQNCQTLCGERFHWLWDRPHYLMCIDACSRNGGQ